MRVRRLVASGQAAGACHASPELARLRAMRWSADSATTSGARESA